MTFRTVAAATTAWTLALAGTVGAQPCPRLPAGLVCAPVPDDESARRELLQGLDLEGRDAVGRGDYALAASAFGCLVEGDPTPESAGNLAVVLREQGALGDALLMARCSEELATPGPARERAAARRLDIERRLGLAPLAPAPLPPPEAPSPSNAEQGAAPSAAPSAARRHAGYAALAVSGAALIASAVFYGLARQRANDFGAEQTANGYSQRARQLHDDGQTFQWVSWSSAGAAAAALLTGGVLLRF